MECFIEWMIESSLLILMILGIRKIFMGKIRYAGVYALWLVVLSHISYNCFLTDRKSVV